MSEVVSVVDTISSADVIKWIEDPTSVTIKTTSEDPAAIAARIDAQVINASSAAELFGETTTIKGRDYLNKPFRLVNVEWRNSDIEGEGLPFYGVFHIVDLNGEMQVMTVGGRSVLLKAAKAASEGWLPLDLKLVKSEKPTSNGYYPLDLVQAPSTQPL